MKLIFLGTGAGMPSRQRNVSSVALQLIEERGGAWLFDCGEATQHQIMDSPVKLGKIEKIFITHLHGDHIFGLPGLLGSRSFQNASSGLTIYGPPGIREFIEICLKVSQIYLTYPLVIQEFEPGVIFEDEQFTVSTDKLDHGVDSFGFRIVQKGLPGPLLVDKLNEAGIPAGPLYRKLKKGLTVTLPDGRQIDGTDYLGPGKKGRIVAILGDTRRCKNAYYLGKEADVLVHEASFTTEHQSLAQEYFHSTAADAAKIAKGAGTKRLILTHISARYQESGSESLLAEARNLFPNTELAFDGAEIEI